MTFTSVLKFTLAAGVSALALTTGANASNPEEMEARLAALEAMVAELRNELEAERARSAERDYSMSERVVTLETREAVQQVTAAASPPGNGFMAGATHITYGGFIDVDAHFTDLSDGALATTSITRDFYIPGATPVGGSGEDAVFDFTAQGSRFFFATATPTAAGEVKSRLEFDFLGSVGGNERVSNSYNPRLRVAWAEMGNWRIGQDWSTFQNTASIPESASFLALSDGMVFVRQPQIRYTNGNFQFAIENPETTVSPTTGGRVVEASSVLPDFVARYNFRSEGVNVSISGLARQHNVSGVYFGNTIDEDVFGWGLSVQGRVSLTESSDVRFGLTGGEGLGRYVGLNAVNGLVVDPSGDVEAIPTLGGHIAWRQELAGGRRFNVGYSHLEADNESTSITLNKRVSSAYAAFMVPINGVTFGAELLYGERELESGATGSISRITLSTKYAF